MTGVDVERDACVRVRFLPVIRHEAILDAVIEDGVWCMVYGVGCRGHGSEGIKAPKMQATMKQRAASTASTMTCW